MKILKIKIVDKSFEQVASAILEDEGITAQVMKRIFSEVKKKSEWDDSVVESFLASEYGEKLAKEVVTANRVNYNSKAFSRLIKQYDKKFD